MYKVEKDFLFNADNMRNQILSLKKGDFFDYTVGEDVINGLLNEGFITLIEKKKETKQIVELEVIPTNETIGKVVKVK